MAKSPQHRSRRRTATNGDVISLSFGTGKSDSISMEEVYHDLTDGQFSSADDLLDDMQRQMLVQRRRATWEHGAWERLPLIVCLCGSSRFCGETYRDANGLTPWQRLNVSETLQGHIVLTIGVDMQRAHDLFGDMDQTERDTLKERLDTLHLSKIDLADHIIVLNVGGYVGASTQREIQYAKTQGKPVYWIEQPTAENLALLG